MHKSNESWRDWPVQDKLHLLDSLRTKVAAKEGSRPSLNEWLKQCSPSWFWDWKHLLYVQSALNEVTERRCNRLMLFLPPRHGKSEMATIRYPVYRLESDSSTRIIVAAYNQTLVNKFSRKARNLARDRVALSEERAAVDDWETTDGGVFRAVGVGGGVTGQGAQLIIIDDPIKSRAEANSKTYRDLVWDWYRDDLYTRLEPDGQIILIMTRWHDDDLAGRILLSEEAPDWKVVSLPALAEEGDLLGRLPGEALCPERFDVPELNRIRTVLGNSFYALYQQTPHDPEGNMFQRDWFGFVDSVPASATRVRYWDKAATEGGGCLSAGVLLAYHEGTVYIEDVVAGQWAAGHREKIMLQTALLDSTRPTPPTIWIEQEPGSGGKESALASIQNLAGFPVYADKVTGDKVVRAEPLAAQGVAGNIRIRKAPWNTSYLDGMVEFPYGKIRDYTDASSGAFNKVMLCAISPTVMGAFGSRGHSRLMAIERQIDEVLQGIDGEGQLLEALHIMRN